MSVQWEDWKRDKFPTHLAIAQHQDRKPALPALRSTPPTLASHTRAVFAAVLERLYSLP